MNAQEREDAINAALDHTAYYDAYRHGRVAALEGALRAAGLAVTELAPVDSGLAKPPHRRSPKEDYDPTPTCLYCGKHWDETGRTLPPQYCCPESPGQRWAGHSPACIAMRIRADRLGHPQPKCDCMQEEPDA